MNYSSMFTRLQPFTDKYASDMLAIIIIIRKM
jgi:hypothetical protein